jgi:hypothetical protein
MANLGFPDYFKVELGITKKLLVQFFFGCLFPC